LRTARFGRWSGAVQKREDDNRYAEQRHGRYEEMTPTASTPSNNGYAGRVVLLAEDEIMIRNYVRTVLTTMGLVVIDAANGKSALDLSRRYEGEIDLLLTNVQMPFVDGIELAIQLRQERPNLKVVVISGHTSGRLAELSERPDFLEKPFLPEVLKQKIISMFSPDAPDVQEV
jgi:CheY-like chemotaxis protein